MVGMVTSYGVDGDMTNERCRQRMIVFNTNREYVLSSMEGHVLSYSMWLHLLGLYETWEISYSGR